MLKIFNLVLGSGAESEDRIPRCFWSPGAWWISTWSKMSCDVEHGVPTMSYGNLSRICANCILVYTIVELNCASKNIGNINPELLRVTWNTTVWRTGSLETLSRCKGLLGATVGAWPRDLSLAHAISFFSMSSLDCLEMYEKSWNLPDLYMYWW